MSRIDRLSGILILLQSKKFVAGERLAEKHIIHLTYKNLREEMTQRMTEPTGRLLKKISSFPICTLPYICQ